MNLSDGCMISRAAPSRSADVYEPVNFGQHGPAHSKLIQLQVCTIVLKDVIRLKRLEAGTEIPK